MTAYHPAVPGPVTRPLTAANATTGNVAGVAAQVTVTGGTGTPSGALPGNVTGAAAHVAVAGGTGTPAGVISAGVVVNQWAATFAQPAAFGNTPPALQSTVIALTPATSVGGGSGTPAAGNWLFCITGWQAGLTAATVGTGDDIHSFWRPGNETTSTWAVSSSSGTTRTFIWYTANLARAPGDVYVAPSGVMAGRACLVVEVAGIGPWDVVTGIATAYVNSARSLTLTLATPSAASFCIAAVTGDNSSASQIFSPAGWATLHTVTASNGTNHAGDAVLTSACLGSGSSAVSIAASAGSSEDLSGVILAVQLGAPSPVPAGNNPAWPYLKFEAAFGGGFQDPQDQLTWTDLSSRLWSWDETTGVQYQLGSIQATSLDMELDNFDGHLSSDSTSGPYYPDLVTGTPLRIRAALGVIGGVTVNRWYVISRNLQEWPQQVDPAYRRYIAGTGTDIWSALSASGPTPYRGEVSQDTPYAWWPCDDQPLAGGVLPVTLLNAATGNPNVLTIQPTSGGVAAGDSYSTTGTDLTTDGTVLTGIPPGNPPPSVAVWAAGQQAGWMYGDPQSSPASYGTSSPVTAAPGSAAWQQTGLLGNTGSNSWFLTCNDTGFPGLSGGVTFGLWFNAAFNGTATGFTDTGNSRFVVSGQPHAAITLATLATASAPVMILSLDSSGHLILETFNGGTGTNHAIYSTSDLRSGSWHHVMITATTSAWTVYVNGGLTGQASGSGAGMTSAWTWLALNADFGSGGGSSLASNAHGGNVAYSHVQVFASILPAWRILAHYCAAVTGFGLLPAPQVVSASPVLNRFAGTSYTPDGTEFGGSYGSSAGQVVSYGYSAVAVAQAGSFTSGPSARTTIAALGGNNGGTVFGGAVWVSWTSLCPSILVYTSSSANNETNAATACGSGDSFTSGYGSGASGHGVCHTAGGTGASPPASASALGDTVAQRLERILGYGRATYPGRCIDPASLPVQAATDIGGQQTGQNLENIAQSDGGLLFVDNLGNLTYWQKSHLAAQHSSPVWTITPEAPPTAGAPATAIPYYREGYRWLADPQRVWNAILITPFSPDGASLADITPTDATSANASQLQYGAQPRQVNSYLQSATEQQSQADWILSNFGQVRIRVDNLRIDAAAYPAAWPLVLGINVGDIVTVQNWQIGGGGTTGTFRVSNVKRTIRFGDDREPAEASVVLQADFEPATYWS